MGTEEARRVGIALEMPSGDQCPACSSRGYSCGTMQSVRAIGGVKSVYRSSLCMSRGEAVVLDTIQSWKNSLLRLAESPNPCNKHASTER